MPTFVSELMNHTIQCCLLGGLSDGFRLGDMLAAMALVAPETITKVWKHRVDVEKCGTHTVGMLVHGWMDYMIPDVIRTADIVVEFNISLVIQYINKPLL